MNGECPPPPQEVALVHVHILGVDDTPTVEEYLVTQEQADGSVDLDSCSSPVEHAATLRPGGPLAVFNERGAEVEHAARGAEDPAVAEIRAAAREKLPRGNVPRASVGLLESDV